MPIKFNLDSFKFSTSFLENLGKADPCTFTIYFGYFPGKTGSRILVYIDEDLVCERAPTLFYKSILCKAEEL